MIVNYSSNNKQKDWKLYNLKLIENKVWNLQVLHFCGTLYHPITNSDVYELITNITERSCLNNSGVICYIYLNQHDKSVNYQPTLSTLYKLRFLDLGVTVFDLRAIGTSVNLKFSEIAIQIEITESHGWF